MCVFVFFFNDTATTEIYTLSLHDALPIWLVPSAGTAPGRPEVRVSFGRERRQHPGHGPRRCPLWTTSSLWHQRPGSERSEEHTSELQSRQYLVCRLLLEKKKK